MTKLTFLRPRSSAEYPTFTAKTFTMGPDGPEKVSDYKLGKFFSVHQDEIADLADLHFSLSEHADGYVRISGLPNEDCNLKNTPRQLIYFPHGESDLMMLDMDKWPTPEPWEFTPQSIHATVRALLHREGFDFLLDAQFLCMLTSSQFATDQISCHLYFMLDHPIHEKVLHDWCLAIKKIRGRALFDPSTQLCIQPDYISPRCCQDFQDPLPESARLSHFQDGAPRLSHKVLQDHINITLNQSGFVPGQSHQAPIGKTWLETVAMCGSPDINEPAFRAAAQIAQKVGKTALIEQIDHYAALMYAAVWEAVDSSAAYLSPEEGGAGRNRKKDQETYGVARFKQYLVAAASKPFGKNADDLKAVVVAAVEKTKTGGSAMALYDQPVLEAIAQLKKGHAGLYADCKKLIKGAGVAISDLEKQLTKEEESEWGEATPTDQEYFRPTIEAFDWMIDSLGTMYAGWRNTTDGRYRVSTLENNIDVALYGRGCHLSDDKVSSYFGKNCAQYMFAQEKLNEGGSASIFKPAEIGLRVAPVGGPNGKVPHTWINLGLQEDGRYLCAFITPEGVELHPEEECPVRWRQDLQAMPILVATEEEILERFDSIKDLKNWAINRLFDFLVIEEDKKPMLLGMVFAMLSGRGTSPLIEFVGPAGSGKSTAADLMVDLIDPVKGGLTLQAARSDLGSLKPPALVSVVAKKYFTLFDNVSKLSVGWQDILCQVSTGTSKDERIMYTNSWTKIFAKRPIIMTALASVITRPDLDSRKETFKFNGNTEFPIASECMIDEWLKDKPFLFMGLLYMLSDGLRQMDNGKVTTGLETRRKWFGLADKLFYSPEQIAAVQQQRKYISAKNMLDSSEFALGMCAWLQSQTTTELLDSTRHLFDKYRMWIRSKGGTEVTIRSEREEILWVVNPVGSVPERLPGFTWELSKYSDTIQAIVGWDVDGKVARSGRTRKRRMYKILTIEDL